MQDPTPRNTHDISASQDESALFLLTASDPAGLSRSVDALITHAEATEAENGSLTALTRAFGRSVFNTHRLAIVAVTIRDLVAKLKRARAAIDQTSMRRLRVRTGIYCSSGEPAGKVALLFPGQGSQYEGMLLQAYRHSPEARAWFEALDAVYIARGQTPPSEVVFPGPNTSAEDRANRARRLVDMEQGAQLGVIASMAAYEMLSALGIRADVMVGHSNGEHAALLASGAIQIPDKRLFCDELCVMGQSIRAMAPPLVPEGMLALNAFDRAALAALLHEHSGTLFLAMDNCPSQVVLGGTQAALDAVEAACAKASGVCIRLPFDRAYHTPLFAACAEKLRFHYEQLEMGTPHTPVYSCATGGAAPAGHAAIAQALADQWTTLVRFRQMIESLYEEGARTFIEVGPNNRLTAFVEDTLRGRPHLAVSASSQHRSDTVQLKHLVGELFALGLPLHIEPLDRFCDAVISGLELRSEPQKRESPKTPASSASAPADVVLIQQMFALLKNEAAESDARILSAVERLSSRVVPGSPVPSSSPLLGTISRLDHHKLETTRHFDKRVDRFVHDHSLGRLDAAGRRRGSPLSVLPFTLSLEILAEAATRLTGARAWSFADVRAQRWLALDKGALTISVVAERVAGEGRESDVRVRIFEMDGSSRRPALEGLVRVSERPARAARATLLRDPEARPPAPSFVDDFYGRFAFHGPTYQGIKQMIAIGKRSIEADLVVTAFTKPFAASLQLDPALLDCTGQLVACWLLSRARSRGERHFGIFPFQARSVIWYGRPLEQGLCVRCFGQIELDDAGRTNAVFEIVGADGALVARVEGLQQRLVSFPERLHQRLFGVEDDGASLSLEPLERSFLSDSFGIWGRALAHLLLNEQELARFFASADDMEGRVRHLIRVTNERNTVMEAQR